jgi:hypothetical protein
MSQLKVDTITDEAGTGSPDFPNGLAGDGSGLSGVVKTSGDQTISGTITATGFVGNGSGLTNLPSSAPTTAQVLTATAGATQDAVGSYAWLATNGEGAGAAGVNVAASALLFAGAGSNGISGNGNIVERSGAVSGTWKRMGYQIGYDNRAKGTLYLRIS